jgi:hypothetical protein
MESYISSISIDYFFFLAVNIAASFITFIKSAPVIPKHLFAISPKLTLGASFLP